jgi:YgiT-type zinc finger domain-containing protein
MSDCTRCAQGERVLVRRAKIAERTGRVAVVLGIPMEECPSCGERYLDWEVRIGSMTCSRRCSPATSRWSRGTSIQVRLRRDWAPDIGGERVGLMAGSGSRDPKMRSELGSREHE